MKTQILKQQLIKELNFNALERARKTAQKILRSDPNDMGIWLILGELETKLQNPADAIKAFTKASLKKHPNQEKAFEQLTLLLVRLGKFEAGLDAATRWLKISKNHPLALHRQGFCQLQLKQPFRALENMRKAHTLDPGNEDIHRSLCDALIVTGHIGEAISVFEEKDFYTRSLDRISRYIEIHNYQDDQYDAQLATKILPALKALCPEQTSKLDTRVNKASKIKLGFLSPDLRRHSVGYFLTKIYTYLDRQQFEIYSYSDNPQKDDMNAFFAKQSDQWRETANLSDKDLIKTISEDAIDILFDLASFTAKRPRLKVFAERAAPIQINYLGYPNTSHLQNMDYRLVDAYSDPEELDRCVYTEKLVRLPHSFLCFDAERLEGTLKTPPCLESERITFGAFNSGLKITDQILKTWGKILQAIPNSYLNIKNSNVYDDVSINAFKNRCEENGIDVERIRVLPFVKSQTSHLELYNEIDIHLDTYPYNGTTTTFESLWMGVPTVTMTGDSHRSRVSASILKNLELDTLVTSSESEYVQCCVDLATNTEQIRAWKNQLRTQLEESYLMDGKAFSRDFGRALLSLLD